MCSDSDHCYFRKRGPHAMMYISLLSEMTNKTARNLTLTSLLRSVILKEQEAALV